MTNEEIKYIDTIVKAARKGYRPEIQFPYFDGSTICGTDGFRLYARKEDDDKLFIPEEGVTFPRFDGLINTSKNAMLERKYYSIRVHDLLDQLDIVKSTKLKDYYFYVKGDLTATLEAENLPTINFKEKFQLEDQKSSEYMAENWPKNNIHLVMPIREDWEKGDNVVAILNAQYIKEATMPYDINHMMIFAIQDGDTAILIQ